MLKKSAFLSLIILSLSTYANIEQVNKMAQENDVDEERRLEVLMEAQRQIANPSKYNREKKKITMDLSAGFNYSEESVGLRAGVFLNSDQQLSLAYYDLGDDERSDFQDYESGYVVELAFKQFSGNSFYVQPHLFYRNFAEEDSFLTFSDESRFHSIEDVGLGVKIGNQWQWQHFTVGVDWVGISRSIKTLDEKGDNDTVFTSSDERTVLTLLNAYIGVSF